MDEIVTKFELDGCVVVPNVVSSVQIEILEKNCAFVELSRAGTRDVLKWDWCVELARSIRSNPQIRCLLGNSMTAVQCTLFIKDSKRNWLVPIHRDYSIPLKEKIDSPNWSAWSTKQSVYFAHPLEHVLDQLIAVRVHMEDTDIQNGALQVVNGSHKSGEKDGERVVPFAPRGSALVMRPLLLHASSKLQFGCRRVLHFLYGPPELPDGAEWAFKV